MALDVEFLQSCGVAEFTEPALGTQRLSGGWPVESTRVSRVFFTFSGAGLRFISSPPHQADRLHLITRVMCFSEGMLESLKSFPLSPNVEFVASISL